MMRCYKAAGFLSSAGEVLSGLRIYIDEIPQDGLRLEGEIDAETLDISDDFVRCGNPLHYRLDISIVSGELLVFGELSVDLMMRCSRCAVMFPSTVSEKAYSYNQQVEKRLEYADLTEDIREAIILAFSSYPICSESCKGLCPQCGANLNEGECGCRPPADARWDGLSGLSL
jgi:uncharacterized protein